MKLTLKQLTERWSTTRRHIHRLIASGDLIALDLSPTGSNRKSYVFDVAEVEAFEERRRTRKKERPIVQRRHKKADYEVFV